MFIDRLFGDAKLEGHFGPGNTSQPIEHDDVATPRGQGDQRFSEQFNFFVFADEVHHSGPIVHETQCRYLVRVDYRGVPFVAHPIEREPPGDGEEKRPG